MTDRCRETLQHHLNHNFRSETEAKASEATEAKEANTPTVSNVSSGFLLLLYVMRHVRVLKPAGLWFHRIYLFKVLNVVQVIQV